MTGLSFTTYHSEHECVAIQMSGVFWNLIYSSFNILFENNNNPWPYQKTILRPNKKYVMSCRNERTNGGNERNHNK